jgi:DNA-binding NarL/FixJ family response regulator
MSKRVRVAIVEDNATARTTIRNHMLPIGELDISSFSTGHELKSALRKQNFEIIMFDFHLGQKRNGVEWVQLLKQENYIRPSTSIIFITADSLPQTIGQIIDIHPDLLILKPYTISTLTRGIEHCLHFRELLQPAFSALDNGEQAHAIKFISQLKSRGIPSKMLADTNKLHARLLLQNEQIQDAEAIYDEVLSRSDKVLWAQWGKLKCKYQLGDWTACRERLTSLAKTNLTKDKAFEWLASLSFEQAAYEQTEGYLNNIKFSDLSVPATQLKSLNYQKQNRTLDCINLLQKKREFNRTTRERFDEFTYELAEFYLSIAEQTPENQRHESLTQARKLIGVAGRQQHDPQFIQRQDFLQAQAYLLEDETEKALDIINHEAMTNFTRSGAQTLLSAAKVYKTLGDIEMTQMLIDLASRKAQNSDTLVEKHTIESRVLNAEQNMGLAEDKAHKLNETGLEYFHSHNPQQSVSYFYKAHQLAPEHAAYTLNLLQSLLDVGQLHYRSETRIGLYQKLQSVELTGTNRQRFRKLQEKYAELFAQVPQEVTGDESEPRDNVLNNSTV